MFLKFLFVIHIFVFGFIAGAYSVNKLPRLTIFESPSDLKIKESVRTTAYSHLENEPGAYKDLNCLGTKLSYYQEPRSAAADWSVYPVGTQFRIAGAPHLYEIDDYGSGLVGTETIDLYKPTLELMNQWGAKNVTVEIVQWGSLERSAKIMERRLQYPHVAEMYRKVNRTLKTQRWQNQLKAAWPTFSSR